MIVHALTQRDEMRPVASKRGIPENNQNCFCDCREDPGGSQIGAAQCAAIAGIPVQEGRFRPTPNSTRPAAQSGGEISGGGWPTTAGQRDGDGQ